VEPGNFPEACVYSARLAGQRPDALIPARSVALSLSRSRIMNVFVRRLGLAAAVLTMASAVAPSVNAQSLPDAKDLIQKYNKAIGGDAWKSHKSARMKATLEVPSAGMRANIEAMNVFSDRTYKMKTEIPGMGEMLAGFDGTTAWSKDPVTGARILSGPEGLQAAEEADPDASMRTSSNILKSETVEKTSMNNSDCFKVKHTWKSGRITHDCFSVSDGLIVASIIKQTTQMGEMEVTQLLSEYKDLGGVKRATLTTLQMMGQEIKTTVTSWEWDTVKPEEMEPPADIKALLKKG